MLLTFVQLHILLAAAPAFANWVLLCPAALGNVPNAPAQIVSLACQTVLEAAAPQAAVRHEASGRQARSRPVICQRLAKADQGAIATGMAFSVAPNVFSFGSFAPFPHAARAP